MTLTDLIEFIFTELSQADNKQIAELINSGSNYTSRLTHALFNKGFLDRFREGRSWVYFVPEGTDQFKEYTYTMRIFGTNKKGKKHSWETEQNLESTIKGVVPIQMTEDQVKEKIKDDLFEVTRTILDNKNVLVKYKVDGSVALDDEDIITGDGDGISGIEFGDTKKEYDPNNEIEVVYRNVKGDLYDKNKGFASRGQKDLSEWF